MRRAMFSAIAIALIAGCGGQDPEPEAAPEQPVSDASTPVVEEPEPAAETAPADAAASDALTADGWENLRIGMTKEEIVAAYGEDANPGAVGGPEPETCDEFRPENAPEGLRVMLTDGKLARITLMRGAEVKTGEGLGLGAKADAVKAVYGGEAEVTPHKYVAAPAEYVTVWTEGETDQPYVEDENARGLRYVVGMDGTVEQIHAGGPAIQLVEGCL